jgi:hypothetical protein
VAPEMNSGDDLDVLWDRLKAARVAQPTSGLAYLKNRAVTPHGTILEARFKGAGRKGRPNWEEQRNTWLLNSS